MATAGTFKTLPQLVGVNSDAGDFADNTAKAILALSMRNLAVTSVPKVTIKTSGSPYTATVEDGIIIVNQEVEYTVLLPLASTCVGKNLFIKKASSINNNMIVTRSGSDYIDGEISLTITGQYTCLHLVSDGIATWYII